MVCNMSRVFWSQGVMGYLHEQNQGNEAFQPVLSYTLNPKCVSMGELYGEYNPLTSEWKDGLASMLIRSAVADTTPVQKWVVFDGPVDALWIENMNTVSCSPCQTWKALCNVGHSCCRHVGCCVNAKAAYCFCYLLPDTSLQ